MAPDFAKKWMQTHLGTIGHRLLSQLCIPGSHDSGTCRLGFHTEFVDEDMIVTQTKTIFEQLELGVRRFDIRPCLAGPKLIKGPQEWVIGHWEVPWETEGHGWQGGNCLTMEEVIGDLNRFTEENAEVIIVEISHEYHIYSDNFDSTTAGLDSEGWKSLLETLQRVKNRFTIARGGKKGESLDYSLNHFIGKGQAAVIILVDGCTSPSEELFSRGLWPMKMDNNTKYLNLELHADWMTVQQTPDEIKACILHYLNPVPKLEPNIYSIIYMARKRQELGFPRSVNEELSMIVADVIENADLLTICLAISYRKLGGTLPVIVYGGHLITDARIQQTVTDAYESRKMLSVTNEILGGDPWDGMRKSCAVIYEQDGLKGRFAREYDHLDFTG